MNAKDSRERKVKLEINSFENSALNSDPIYVNNFRSVLNLPEKSYVMFILFNHLFRSCLKNNYLQVIINNLIRNSNFQFCVPQLELYTIYKPLLRLKRNLYEKTRMSTLKTTLYTFLRTNY